MQQTMCEMSSCFSWACCRQNDAGVAAQKLGQCSTAFDHFTGAIRLHPRRATYHANRCGLIAQAMHATASQTEPHSHPSQSRCSDASIVHVTEMLLRNRRHACVIQGGCGAETGKGGHCRGGCGECRATGPVARSCALARWPGSAEAPAAAGGSRLLQRRAAPLAGAGGSKGGCPAAQHNMPQTHMLHAHLVCAQQEPIRALASLHPPLRTRIWWYRRAPRRQHSWRRSMPRPRSSAQPATRRGRPCRTGLRRQRPRQRRCWQLTPCWRQTQTCPPHALHTSR